MRQFVTISQLIHGSFFRSLPLKNRPQRYILSAVAVCVILIVAGLAPETQAVPVRPLCMTANSASLRSITRINFLESDPNLLSLVLQEELTLAERPTVHARPQSFAFPVAAVSDRTQILNHDRTSIDRPSKSHYLLTCKMTKFLRYGSFLAAQPPQEAASGTSANASNFCSGLSNLFSLMVEGSAFYIQSFVSLGVEAGHQVFDARIDSNNSAFCLKFRDLNFDRKDNIPVFPNSLESGVGPLAFGHGSVLVVELLTPDGESLGREVEIPPPADRNVQFLELSQLPSFVSFCCSVRSDDMSEQRTSDLTWELEIFSHSPVELVRESRWRFDLISFVYDTGQPICCVLVGRSNFEEIGVIPLEFEFGCPDRFFHTNYYFDMVDETPLMMSKEFEEAAFLPYHKGRGFLP